MLEQTDRQRGGATNAGGPLHTCYAKLLNLSRIGILNTLAPLLRSGADKTTFAESSMLQSLNFVVHLLC